MGAACRESNLQRRDERIIEGISRVNGEFPHNKFRSPYLIFVLGGAADCRQDMLQKRVSVAHRKNDTADWPEPARTVMVQDHLRKARQAGLKRHHQSICKII